MPSEPISLGICVYPIQALDAIGFVDVLVNLLPKDIEAFAPMVPNANVQTLIDKSPDIKFHWIGLTMDPVECTANIMLKPTCTYDDCPKLDYILIGGPYPEIAVGDLPDVVRLREFLHQQVSQVKKIFTTCTGALTLASTGLLDGVEATVNHAVIPFAKDKFPAVKWVSEKNWVEGEKFWTAGGAVAGMDMAGEWVRQMTGIPDLLYLTTITLDWVPRDVDGNAMDHYNGNRNFIKGVSTA